MKEQMEELTLLTLADIAIVSVKQLNCEIIHVDGRAARFIRIDKRGPGIAGPENPLWYVATLTGFNVVTFDEGVALEEQYQHRKLLEDLNYDSKQ